MGELFLFWLLTKLFGGDHGGASPKSSVQPAPTDAKIKEPEQPAHLPEGAKPVLTSTAAPFRERMPAGLPPWPSGWKSTTPTPSIVQRAWALMTALPIGSTKVENTASGWRLFYSYKMGDGRKGVAVYEPKAVDASPHYTNV